MSRFDGNLEADLKDPSKVRDLQSRLLVETVEYVLERSPFYREVFGEAGIGRGLIKSVDDIQKLPVTTKEDLQGSNWSFLCTVKSEISETVSTTGTTGSPVFLAMTGADVTRLAENERRWFAGMGLGPGDPVQIAVTMDSLFIAGLAYYTGLKRLGAGVIRSGPRNAARQLELIKSLKPKAVVAVPSFLLRLAELARDAGLDPSKLGLSSALLIGEAVREEDFTSNFLGKMVEDTWKIECFSTYGITEGALAFCECGEHRGLHSHPDMVFAEILDDGGERAPDGEAGELVITTLQVEGMPLVRYRTGDITFMVPPECPCGLATQMIGPIVGRKAQKLKLKGTTVYPGAIEKALSGVAGVKNFQIVASTGGDGTDRVLVKVGSDRQGSEFVESLREAIRDVARVTPELELATPTEVEELLTEGGARKKLKFKDLRGGGATP